MVNLNNKKTKILRVTTVAGTMNVILKGQLKYLNQFFDIVGATSQFFNYFDEIREREGIKLYEVKLTRQVTPIKDLLALFKMIQVVLNERPEIIHTQTPKANIVGMLAGFLCGTKIRVLSIVGMPAYKNVGVKGRILNWIDNLSYKMATHIYPNSKGLFEHYSLNKYAKNKLGFIGHGSSNGIDFNYYDPNAIPVEKIIELKKELKIEQSNFVFAFMGRVVNDKGIRELLDAFISFCEIEQFAHCRLLVIGPVRESDDPIPKNYQDILCNHPKIIHVGLQRDVRPYLMVSNAFVFPSYREGLPGSLIQAGAMGLPLIASDIIGNREIISQSEGILVPIKNSYALAIEMQDLINDCNKFRRISNGMREKIRQLYDQNKYWELLKLEYETLLANVNN